MTTLTYDKLDNPAILDLIFYPRRGAQPADSNSAVTHLIPVADGISIGSRFHLAASEEPHILFFHGNGELAEEYDDLGPHFIAHGLSFLAVDYRGYGNSGGTPSASAMMADARAIFRYVEQWRLNNKRSGPLFVMGRSLGSASALEVASTFQDEIKGVILESAFAQTMPLLLDLGVDVQALSITEVDGFKNVQKIETITKPVFILHAQHDQLLPIVNAEILHRQCAARSKELSLVPGADHNTIIDVAGERYFAVLKQFTNKILKARARKVR